jgi:fatty acid desaturase
VVEQRQVPALYVVGAPLVSPIKVARSEVPPNVKREVYLLMRPAAGAFLFQWTSAWVIIIGSISAAVHLDNPWTTLLAIFIVATRQNLLALLMHEQTHWLASRLKWADYFCELLIAYPLLVTLEGYRRVHLSHHAGYFTENDPDYLRKQGRAWTFPQEPAYFFSVLLRDLFGITVWKTLKGKAVSEASSLVKANFYPPRWLRPVFFAALFLGLTLSHTWKIYLVYWVLPLFTIMQLFIKWGAISEHKYNLVHPSVEESSPLIELRWWERLLFPNMNFTLHIYHHWYQTIPASQLPKVHKLFRKAGLVDDRYVFHGYGAYLRSLLIRKV